MNYTVKNTAAGKVFVFKQEWFDALRELSARVRLEVYEAIMMYQATGEVPEEMTKVARMAFFFIRKEIDGMAVASPEDKRTSTPQLNAQSVVLSQFRQEGGKESRLDNSPKNDSQSTSDTKSVSTPVTCSARNARRGFT